MKKKDLTLTIGEKLRIYRRRNNIPAWEMAKQLGVSTPTYYAIERGEVMPTKEQYGNISMLPESSITPGERLSVHIWRRGGLQRFCRKHDLNYTRISAICNGAEPYTEEKIKLVKLIGEWQ